MRPDEPARRLRPAVVSVLAVGLAHAALFALLAAGGHAPGFTGGLPVAPDAYYRAAAFYIAPLYFALWLVAGAASYGAARALGGRGTLRNALAVLGPAYALPLLLLFVVPDIAVYLAAGHDALAAAMRWYAPLAPLTVLLLAGRALRRVFGLRRLPALAAAFAGFVAQALPAAWLIR